MAGLVGGRGHGFGLRHVRLVGRDHLGSFRGPGLGKAFLFPCLEQLLFGDGEENLQTIATEGFLSYKIDFAAGYSVGLFIDQRENRRYVRQSKPKRLLNCFAYTCSFSVAAATVGAQTVSIDLSKKSLERGRENFALNSLSTTDHRFIADDVLTVMPRHFARVTGIDDHLVLRELPFDQPLVHVDALWHRRAQHAHAHGWLRQALLRSAQAAFAGP